MPIILHIQNPQIWEYPGDFRVVNSISCGVRFVYIAGNGIARYDKLFSKWEMPFTRTAFPNNIKLIAQDSYTNEIWFVVNDEIGRYNPIFEDYRLIEIENKGSETCSLGIARDFICLWDSKKCMKFNKANESWSIVNSLPSDAEWTPEDSPYKYSYLAPWYVMDKSASGGLRQYEITCVAEDEQWLWVGTNGLGVYKYDNISHFVAEHYLSGIPGGEVISMFKDESASGGLWFSCSEGIVKKEGNSYSYFPLERTPNLLLSNGVAITGNGEKIWIASREGISQYDKQSGIWINFTESELRDAISLSAKGNKLWVGTKRGLVKLEKGMIEEIFENIWVNDIEQDSTTLWVGTSRGVFYKTNSPEWQNLKDPYKILGFGVNEILSDGDKVYFGTGQGLLIYNTYEENWDRFTYPVSLPGKEVLSLAKDERNLYIGTNNGLAIWDKERDIWTRYTKNNSPVKGKVYSIILAKGYAYLNTQNGLVKLKVN